MTVQKIQVVVQKMTRAFSLEPRQWAVLLRATGLGVLGLLGWRRKRKAQALA
jgi:hypothetical protein